MRIARLLVGAFGLCSALLVANSAQARGLDACGDFLFDPLGDVECSVEFEGGCTAHCEPLSFELQCASTLYLDCQAECDVDIDVGCTADCEAGCMTECSGGGFDCEAHCGAGCSAECDSYCDPGDNECHSSCSATCSAECGASCSVELPDCETSCHASCEGECHASANIDCQVGCQAGGYIDCEASLQGGCEVACQSPSGAIFCDGQWINTDDLDSCVDAIVDAFSIEVTGYADASCSGNTCKAEAGCTATCAAAPSTPATDLGFAGLSAAAVSVVIARRARRNAKKG